MSLVYLSPMWNKISSYQGWKDWENITVPTIEHTRCLIRYLLNEVTNIVVTKLTINLLLIYIINNNYLLIIFISLPLFYYYLLVYYLVT